VQVSFNCLKCGRCCHEIPGTLDDQSYKRIPLYPEEADRLEDLAKKRDIKLRIIEDLVFPDIKNKKILVLTWRIMLDNAEQVCPFYQADTGCTIHDQKPLACQAYPLAIKSEDAFNMKIEIAPLCLFTEENRANLESITYADFVKIYAEEFKLAKKLLARNKEAIMNLMGKERLQEIEIPRKISTEDFDKYLKNWERDVL
jgi:Fe-S-cluster containining protein